MMKCTSLRSLSVALLVNLLHFLQQLAHVKRVWGSWRRLKELIYELEGIQKHVTTVNKDYSTFLETV